MCLWALIAIPTLWINLLLTSKIASVVQAIKGVKDFAILTFVAINIRSLLTLVV
jgi:hypothetical protein